MAVLDFVLLQKGGTLVLRDLRREDIGNYICVASSAGVFDIETTNDFNSLSEMVRDSANVDIFKRQFYNFWGLMLCIQTTKSEAILIVSVCVTLRTKRHVTDLREYK